MIDTWLVVLIAGSTVVLLTAEVVVRMLFSSSAATRFSIRQIAVCSLLLFPIGFLLLPEVPLGFAGLGSSGETESALPLKLPGDQSRQSINFPSLDKSVSSTSLQISPAPRGQLPVGEKTASTAKPVVVARPSHPAVPREFRFSVSMIAVTIWLAVALAFLTRTLLAHFRAEFATDPNAEPIVPTGNQWLPTRVGAFYSPRHAVPVTVGFCRRRIVLPAAAKEWSVDQRRMVLKHELAHVVRRDVLWQLISSIATSCFWFQPLVWHADRRLRLERERACDDQVLASGEVAEDYATVLVSLAAVFSGRTMFPVGVISMAQKPIEQRLKTILSPSTNRASATKWLSTLTTAIALMLVVVVCSVRPFAPIAAATPVAEQVQSNVEGPQLDDDHFPSRLTGLVVDENDQPVAGARVKLTATPRTMNELGKAWHKQGTVDLPVVVSDDSGKFVIDVGKLSTDKDFLAIQGAVNAKDRPTVSIYINLLKDSKSSFAFQTLRFQPGKTIVGRVVPPAGSEDARLVNPVITVSSGFMAGPSWRATVDCEIDGRFSVIVPTDVAVSIQAAADNFAGTGFEVLPQARDLQDIQLLEGTTITGKVLDRDRRPVAGVYVVSETDADLVLSFDRGSVGPQRFFRRCKTNANGEYQLKPQAGKIRVSLSSQVFNRSSQTLSVSERKPPVVVPLLVDLAGSELTRTIDLTEAKTVQASGAIRWPDGSPVVGIDVDVQMMVGRYSTSVFRTKTDDNGKYVASIPENNPSFIHVYGTYDLAKQGFYLNPETNSSKVTQKSSGSLMLAPLTEDVTGLDWKLSKPDTTPAPQRPPAMRELEDLLAAQHDDRAKGEIRIAGAVDEEEKKQLTERFAKKSKTNAAKIVAFEAKHRGEFAGAVALASYIDLGQPEQLDAFTANYLESPNADVVIAEIEDIVTDVRSHTGARKLLKTFSEASPHPSVQAASLYKEAELIAFRLQIKEYYKQSEWLRPLFPEQISKDELNYKQMHAEILAVNEDQLLADFDKILQTLKVNFPEHGSTIGDHRRTDAVSETYANQLQAMRFTLANIRSGQPLPRLTGRDVHGVDFDSERLKGKAVLLFFASKQTIDWMDFNKLKELKTIYAGRPFEIVSVMVDEKLEDAKSVVDTGIISWSTLYDADQQLMEKWRLGKCQETLLVDHQGIIHRRAYAGMELDQTIDQLVKNAESK